MKKIDREYLKMIIDNFPEEQLPLQIIRHLSDKVDIGKIFSIILSIKEKENEEREDELYKALDSSFNYFGSVTKELIENKTSHKAKNAADYIMKKNSSVLGWIFKGYDKNAFGKGSIISNYFFEKFKNMIKKERNVEWEKMMEVHDYYNKVIENDSK